MENTFIVTLSPLPPFPLLNKIALRGRDPNCVKDIKKKKDWVRAWWCLFSLFLPCGVLVNKSVTFSPPVSDHKNANISKTKKKSPPEEWYSTYIRYIILFKCELEILPSTWRHLHCNQWKTQPRQSMAGLFCGLLNANGWLLGDTEKDDVKAD